MALQRIASCCKFSSSAVRSLRKKDEETMTDILSELFRRLPSRNAKWLTRLILKNYQPVELDPATVFRAYDSLLPMIIQVQDDFSHAITFLQRHRHQARQTGQPLSKENLVNHLIPRIGVKVGRQRWEKGRGIKHCLTMGHGLMACEHKLDGEYCQIHIDLSKGRDCIQIFSKSRKDSTADRCGLHE